MDTRYTTFFEICSHYWPILLVSFVASLVATPLCRRFALRRRIVDSPDNWLKPHRRPVPYLGGVAIFMGWAAGVGLALVLFGGMEGELNEPRSGPSVDRIMGIGILLAGLGIMLVGLLDDLRLTSPAVKLLGISIVTAVLILVGVGDDTILVLLKITGIHVPDFSSWLILVYSVPLALCVTMAACNATNLIDGVDGLCSGVMGIIAAGFLVLSTHQHLWSAWHPWDVQRVTLSLAMMGACLGFLPYNRNPARIFMGDAGSMLLGLNAAILILLFSKSNAVRWLLASIMVFGLPLADLVLTMARRWRNERPIMQGDRSHFYDQLIDRGWPVRRVVVVSYTLAAFFAIAGCLAIKLRTRYSVLLYALVLVGLVAAFAKFKMVRLEKPPEQKHTSEPPKT